MAPWLRPSSAIRLNRSACGWAASAHLSTSTPGNSIVTMTLTASSDDVGYVAGRQGSSCSGEAVNRPIVSPLDQLLLVTSRARSSFLRRLVRSSLEHAPLH